MPWKHFKGWCTFSLPSCTHWFDCMYIIKNWGRHFQKLTRQEFQIAWCCQRNRPPSILMWKYDYFFLLFMLQRSSDKVPEALRSLQYTCRNSTAHDCCISLCYVSILTLASRKIFYLHYIFFLKDNNVFTQHTRSKVFSFYLFKLQFNRFGVCCCYSFSNFLTNLKRLLLCGSFQEYKHATRNQT